MVDLAEKTFEMLKAGTPPEEVRKVVGSGSQFTKGSQRYLKWGATEIEVIQQSIQMLDAKRSQLEKANEKLDEQHDGFVAEVNALTDSKERLSADNQQESKQLEGLRERIKQADSELVGLQVQRQGLIDKGYTDEIISKLSSSDAAHGGDMLARVQTLEGYEAEAEKQNSALRGLSADLEEAKNELKQLTEISQRMKDEITRQEEALHRRQEEERVFEGMVEECGKILEEIRKTSKESRKQHNDQLKEYGRLQAEAGKHAADIERAIALLDLEGSPAALKNIGKDTVELLLSRLLEWSKRQHWDIPPTLDRITLMGAHFGGVELEETLEWARTLLEKGELAE